MNTLTRVLIVCLLAMAVTAILIVKSRSAPPSARDAGTAKMPTRSQAAAQPRLVDLGAGTCIPCKMMEPVLEELRVEYADLFTVELIDVSENPAAGGAYGLRVIPTQIFYDADGRELFRHEGFYTKEDILAKWREFGVVAEEIEQK
jgi:thioredoxin 1